MVLGGRGMAVSALLFAASLLALPVFAAPEEVDVSLVLAIDCSYSVDSFEHRLQMAGFAAALESTDVLKAIASGKKQKIAVTVFQWSDANNQRVIVPWTVIDGAQSAAKVAKVLEPGPRRVSEGGTGISAALLFADSLFLDAPRAERHVIDIATDGQNNMGDPPQATRDAIVAQAITINALAIINDVPDLDAYLEQFVAGGAENFVLRASNYNDFGAAMLQKLVKEITGPGVT